MRKFRLDVDALGVDSFDTTAAPAPPKGTVRGFASDPWSACCSNGGSCYAFCTAGDSCAGTCEAVCVTNASCDTTCFESPCVQSGAWTCDGSTCAGTCGASCNATCTCTEPASCPCP
jgi:hypothetical protein